MKKHLLIIICLALVATAANAQTITDVLRRDQQGQGKVVINQSADIERLVNNRQQQNTTTQQNGKTADKQNNQQQNTKPADKQGNQQQNTKPADKQGNQQAGKTSPTQDKSNNNAAQHFGTSTNNNAQQHQNEQRSNGQNVNERQPERNNQTVTERPNDHQTTEHPTSTERINDRQATEHPISTERPSASFISDYDAPAVNTNKKIMRHSYKTTGYRIQVYTGGNKRADRTKCEQIAARLKSAFPDEPIYVHFYSPSWKCRLGNFTSMSEAKTCLKQIRRMGYNQACIVKGRISVQY